MMDASFRASIRSQYCGLRESGALREGQVVVGPAVGIVSSKHLPQEVKGDDL